MKMGSSEADLSGIEAQRSTDASHHKRKGTYFPMNLLNKGANKPSSQGFSQSRGDGTMPPTGDTESVPEFLTNLKVSDLFALPGEDVKMNPDIFSGISGGNKKCLEKLRSQGTPMARLKSNEGDSVLHLAATWGHLELVKEIVSECPCLLLKPNLKDQTPLHVAAHGGHTSVVAALVALVTFALDRLSDEESERLDPYVMKDKDGNAALHLALKGRYVEMAACLVKANHDASFLVNNEKKSSLFLAVEAGDVSLVKTIFKLIGNDDREWRNSNIGRRYLAHVALKARNTDILDVILKEDPRFEDELDNEGRTCLSFGASIGNYEGVCNLLDRSPESVYVCDEDGSFPIHKAAEMGHRKVLLEFIKRCPDSKYLLNKLGQNILHIAAKVGDHHLITALMMNKETKHLGVGQDVDGNTPLHLATINWRSQSITRLASNVKILQLENNNGLKARDIAESEMKSNYIFQEGLESIESITKPSDAPDPKKNKDYVNTLLLVAALVATMTFAAGFTTPGGFNSSAPHLGRATLATNPTLFIFLLLDILAMQSSVATIATLIWAQLGDPALIRSSLNVALPLLLFALLCMPLAFLFGVVTAVGHVKGLLAIICIISILFFGWVTFVLGPHVMLQLSNVSPELAGDFLVTFMEFKEHYFKSIMYSARIEKKLFPCLSIE